jgi:hypothetical protein
MRGPAFDVSIPVAGSAMISDDGAAAHIQVSGALEGEFIIIYNVDIIISP